VFLYVLLIFNASRAKECTKETDSVNSKSLFVVITQLYCYVFTDYFLKYARNVNGNTVSFNASDDLLRIRLREDFCNISSAYLVFSDGQSVNVVNVR
jgi:hypothetical protein